MGFGDNGNGMSPADFAALMGNNGNNGNGNGLFGDNAWWIIVLLIMMFCCGGFGGGNGAGNILPYMMMNQQPAPASSYTDANVTRGFDQAAVMGAIRDVGNGVTSGFADTALGIAGVNQALCNGFSQAEIAANSRQMASMNQDFNAQTSMMQGFTTVGSKLSDLGADVAREACADRQVVTEGLMNLTAQNNQNTNTIVNTINSVGQDIKNELFAARMAEKDDLIAQLRQENLYARGQASQVAQNGQIVDAIYNRLATCPVGTTPVYGQTPIFTCPNQSGQTCPCGNVA